MKVLFAAFCFPQVFHTLCFPCIMFAISTAVRTGILLHAALHFLPVFLLVHALIMRYGTVVYSVSEGDIGLPSRELPVALNSCTGELLQ